MTSFFKCRSKREDIHAKIDIKCITIANAKVFGILFLVDLNEWIDFRFKRFVGCQISHIIDGYAVIAALLTLWATSSISAAIWSNRNLLTAISLLRLWKGIFDQLMDRFG